MPMTLTQKILAKASDKVEVVPGDIVEARVDLVMGHDVLMPLAFEAFEETGATKLFDVNKVVAVQDHFVPAPDVKSAEQSKRLKEYVKKYSMVNYFELGRGGVCHTIIPEKGFVVPGDVAVGSDSHTTTYGALGAFATGLGSSEIGVSMALGKMWFRVPEAIKVVLNGKPGRYIGGKDVILEILRRIGTDGARYCSLEFAGDGIKYLDIDDRLTICNMAVETGAKNAIFEVDSITNEYLQNRVKKDFDVLKADDTAEYKGEIEIDLSKVVPLIAAPHSPDNVKEVHEIKGVKVDQVYIGSCTNGRIKDLREAAEILKGKKVNENTRLIVVPSSQEVYKQALQEGLIDTFLEAGAAIGPPTCGACCGGHMGLLASGEVCVSTTNRNFIGRMGSKESYVYLTSPYVAAATAVAGKIVLPEEA
ncbi:3-isopropylmalate dehydratase large subunit [Calorimonas adulescens]|uniref:3-isopropylmalate dehydratase large subunit n=1 Tax=Calorimonas adulescens TaxID=2606906 RepID=A0A5D8QAG7_9THEO|nr:3-isopropylmalate dehydratase large subunit [Calorimonas adulescens]TZE81511.1 3-isopropylmalate dehydratase large subunit [Calorimonas adulescens]